MSDKSVKSNPIKKHGNAKIDPFQLEEMLKTDLPKGEIAEMMGVHRGSISRAIAKHKKFKGELTEFRQSKVDRIDSTIRRLLNLMDKMLDLLEADDYKRLREMSDGNIRSTFHTIQGGVALLADSVRKEKGIDGSQQVVVGVVDLSQYRSRPVNVTPHVTPFDYDDGNIDIIEGVTD